MIRIGLSYHAGCTEYDAYYDAVARRCAALGVPAEILWLAGADRPFLTHRLVGLQALCLTGGEDFGAAPQRDPVEIALLEHVARKPLPLLAICRGAQMLNVFYGGTLIQDLGDRNAVHRAPPARTHAVDIERGTLLSRIAGGGEHLVNSSHHQAVEQIAPGFRISARSPDGVIEALEWAEPTGKAWLLAVQWHPELPSPQSELADGLLGAFILAARP